MSLSHTLDQTALHNPLMLRRSGTAWVGVALQQPHTVLYTFNDPASCYRAGTLILRTLRKTFRMQTVPQLLRGWKTAAVCDFNDQDVTAIEGATGILRYLPFPLEEMAPTQRLLAQLTRIALGTEQVDEAAISVGYARATAVTV